MVLNVQFIELATNFEVVNSTTIGNVIGKGFLITTKQLISWLFKRYCLLTNLSV